MTSSGKSVRLPFLSLKEILFSHFPAGTEGFDEVKSLKSGLDFGEVMPHELVGRY
jgi:hypothetical protein